MKQKSKKELSPSVKRNLQTYLQKNYSLEANFTIFGSLGRKSNSRRATQNGFVLGKGATDFINLFDKQLKRIKLDSPYINPNYFWLFEIFYNDIRADASIELIFDLLERNKVVLNDVTIRNYLVQSFSTDKELPRVNVSIYLLRPQNDQKSIK